MNNNERGHIKPLPTSTTFNPIYREITDSELLDIPNPYHYRHPGDNSIIATVKVNETPHTEGNYVVTCRATSENGLNERFTFCHEFWAWHVAASRVDLYMDINVNDHTGEGI